MAAKQNHYVNELCPVHLDQARRAPVNSPVAEDEATSLRGLTGSLCHATANTRPDLAAKAGELQ